MTQATTPATVPSHQPPIVLAAVDASSAATLVFQKAMMLAQTMGAVLHLVQAVEVLPSMALGGSSLLLASNARLIQQAWLELERLMASAQPTLRGIHGHVSVGNPVTRILQLATDLEADVLVVGTHDPGKVESLLFGSMAAELTRKAPCPVLVVRPKRQAHPDVPEILPPCPDCLTARAASQGQTMWCERHSERHPQAHTYHESPGSFAVGSLSFRP